MKSSSGPSSAASKPTIRDVAAAAGVSVGTASRVMTKKYPHRAEVRDRVLEAAERLGYRPDRMASHLGMRKGNRRPAVSLTPLAHLVRNARGDAPGEAGFLHQRAMELGYSLDPVNLQGRSDAQVCRELYARGYEGLVIGSILPVTYEIEFDWEKFSVVGLGTSLSACRVHHVGTSAFDNMARVWREVFDHGYRRIGAALLVHDFDFLDDEARLAAVEFCQARFLKNADRVPTYTEGFSTPDVDAFGAWAGRWKPEAVIGFHAGFGYRLRQLGYRIPEEIGYAVLEGGPNTLERHGFACLDTNRTDQGSTAIELLDNEIRHGRRGRPERPRRICVFGPFLEGPSLPRKG